MTITYEWRKVGNPTILGSAKTFTIPAAGPGDVGSYVCTVKGGSPEVSGQGGENILRLSTTPALVYPAQTVGSYLGVIARGKNVANNLGGRLDLTTTSAGAFTAKLTSDGVASTVKGTLVPTFTGLNLTGAAGRADFVRKGKATLRLDFTLDLTTGTVTSNTLSGTLTDLVTATNGTTAVSTALTGYRNVWSKTTKPATVYVNQFNYLLEIPSSVVGDLDVPQGNGFGSFKVAVDGKVAVAGQTADGLAYTSAGFIGPDVAANDPVKLHIYSMFKAPGGSIMGTGTITPAAHTTFTGSLSWNRAAEPATSKGVTYRAGFAPHDLTIVGGVYTAPAAGGVIGGLDDLNNLNNNVRLVFTDGGLTDADLDGSDANTTADDFQFSISNSGTAVAQTIKLPPATDTLNNYNKITFKLAAAPAGQFSGTLTVPNATTTLVRVGKFNGMMVQTTATTWVRAGYFLIAQPPQSGQTVTTSNILSGQVTAEDPTP